MSVGTPMVMSEEVPYDKGTDFGDNLDLMRPLGGQMWWNSLYWTNFPPLACFNEQTWEENKDADFFVSVSAINSNGKLSEQYVTFAAAREDLCTTTTMPNCSCMLTVECMQYEGHRDIEWQFPLKQYIPRRDNHQPYNIQSRRFYDNNVMHFGLNAMEFSEKITPVGDLDAHICLSDMPINPTWGYYFVILRIGGWPYKVKKIGSFEGYGENGHREQNFGLGYFDQKMLWDMLEGPASMSPTGPNGEMEVQLSRLGGYKFYAQLYDLDTLGPKVDEKQHYNPTITPEKGWVWFKVVETITVPSSGQKGVKVELLDEGIVPAWMDLNFMQVFAGSLPLGHMNEMESDGPPSGTATVYRTVNPGTKKVVVKNDNSQIVFDDPMTSQLDDFCDMGWALYDCCYQGAQIKLSSRPGKWAEEVGEDEGPIAYKAAGPPPLAHGEGASLSWIQTPKTKYPYERRLVM